MMQVKVLFDKKSINDSLHTGWGLSFIIDGRVLFDTGEDGAKLLDNMQKMRVRLDELKSVIMSHDHWDHTGGLWEVLKRRKSLKVYGCPHFSREFKDKVKALDGTFIELNKFTEIGKNIFATGELPGVYKGEYLPEQAVVAKTENGFSVITGCSHPGIVKILEKVKENFSLEKFHCVFGGFHLKDSSKGEINSIVEQFKEMNVEKVGPTHCSGEEAEEMFKKNYGRNFIAIKVGQRLEI